MTARALLMAFFIVTACAAEATAAPPWVSASAGASVPTGDLARAFGGGFHGGLSVAALDGGNAFGVTMNYHMLANKTVPVDFGESQTQRADIFEAGPFARVLLLPETAPMMLYLKWGFGLEFMTSYITLSTPYFSEHSQASRPLLGAFGGLGLSVPFNRTTGLGVEGLFRRINTDAGHADMFSISLEYWAKPKG